MHSFFIRFFILLSLVSPSLVLAATVVEFYNTNLDNYFITSDAGESAAIDNGSAGPGWSRTGNTFESGGNASVCRFYGSQSPGPNSHFYTVDSEECQGLKDQQIGIGDPRKLTVKSWNFESLDFVSTPATNQTCPSGTTPVYRAYNNGFTRGVDSNHRITTNLTSIQQMEACGWSNEGVVMCAPSGTTSGGSTSCVPLSNVQTLTGVFIDSPVQGLTWSSGFFTGTTDAAGTFQCTKDGTISFYVGGTSGILVGTTACNTLIMPLDLVAGAQDYNNSVALNIVSFLMTLDDDNNPANGIVITDSVGNLASGQSLNFSQTTADFAFSSSALIANLTAGTSAGAHLLTSAAAAQAHVTGTLGTLLAGSYQGTYTNQGTWAGILTPQGSLSGTWQDFDGTAGTLQGTVSINGRGTAELGFGTSSSGTRFWGHFYPNGTASGEWTYGTWKGVKIP